MSSALMPMVLSAIAALSVGLIFAGAAVVLRRDPVRVRLDEYAVQSSSLEQLELSLPFTDRVLRPFFRGVSSFLLRRTPQQSIERLRHDLLVAGNPGNLDVSDFLGIKGIAALTLSGLTMLFLSRMIGFWGALLCAGGAALVGYIFPSFWLRSRISSRRKEITKALPDCLDLLVISVEAGLGFDGAMQKVAEKWDNHLTREFGRALSEMRVGATRRDALRGITERTDAPDVSAFISAIIQADQLGVSVGRVLHLQADQMRVKRRQRAEEQAHKAPIKMLFPMILLIFPSMYIVILGPAIPQILKSLPQ